jgi:hypothetical protein
MGTLIASSPLTTLAKEELTTGMLTKWYKWTALLPVQPFARMVFPVTSLEQIQYLYLLLSTT